MPTNLINKGMLIILFAVEKCQIIIDTNISIAILLEITYVYRLDPVQSRCELEAIDGLPITQF